MPGAPFAKYVAMWIDFGDGSVPFWQQIFARPGVIAAASNFLVPPKLRAAGAKTVYWDMHLNNRVGTPQKPLSPAGIVDQADRLYMRAVASSGCATPVTPSTSSRRRHITWSDSNTRTARTILTLSDGFDARRPPLPAGLEPAYTGGDAQWWRDASQVADLVREVCLSAAHLEAGARRQSYDARRAAQLGRTSPRSASRLRASA